MRIIVLSDTHQYYRNFETIVLRHPDADMFIHLGDGESEYQLLCRNMPEVSAAGANQGLCEGFTAQMPQACRSGTAILRLAQRAGARA